MNSIRMALAAVAVAAGAPFLTSQTAFPQALEAVHWHASGILTNADPVEPMVVHQYTLTHAGAASLRVVFGDVTLGAGDWVELRSANGDRIHRLNQAELIKWQFTSAFFNGDTVVVELWLQPGSTGEFEIAGYLWGPGGTGSPATFGPDTICGTDDRIASMDNRAGRFVSSATTTGGGCTIWLFSADSCAASAGHCFSGGTLVVAEFDLPPSLASGALQHPPVEDQFPIDTSTVAFTNGGVGNDWGIVRLFPNNIGQTASQRYGHYTLGNFVPALNDVIRITGCGTDDTVDNQTLQTHTGPFAGSSTPTALQYAVDTTGGNSGSPVIFETTGQAIGIHTHGGCTATGGANSGTSVTHSGFVTAAGNLCQFTATQPPIASFTPTSSTILAGQSVSFTSTSQNFPASFAWDLDGDGTVDSMTNPAGFTYLMPGTYDVTLTVTNALGSDSVTVTGAVTVNPIQPAQLPYAQDFNAGLPAGGEWTFESEIGGRILATIDATPSPNSAGNALVMDCTTQGASATNDATLYVDLSSVSGAQLTYWWRETLDEDDPQDGVFLSDGTNEILAFSHNAGPTAWTPKVIDVHGLAVMNGLSLVSDFRIIFRQRDNFPLGTDGVLIDDISIVEPMMGGGQPNTPGAGLRFSGVIGPIYGQGPFMATYSPGDLMQIEFEGDAGEAVILLAGPPNVGNASFVIGQLDIGLLGASNLSDIQVVLNGAAPSTFLDQIAIIGPTRYQTLSFSIPAFPPGSLGGFQAAIYRTATGLPLFTAATEVLIN